MARIFLCAPALGEYMLNGTWAPEMPSSFRINPERIARLRKNLARKEDQGTTASHEDEGPPLDEATIS